MMTLSTEALSLIDAYQAGREVLSEDVLHKLAQIVHALSPVFGECSEAVFHKTDLPVGDKPDVYGRTIATLLAKSGLTLPAASYTTSAEIATDHKLSKAAAIENTFGVIFEIPSERISRAVILNLDKMYKSGVIGASLADHPEAQFRQGIRNVGNREREVIIGPTVVTVNDVYAIRAPTQSLASYAEASSEVFDEPETSEEKSIELYDRLESQNLLDEHAAWIYGGKARKVLHVALTNARQKGANTSSLISPEKLAVGDSGGLDVIPLPSYKRRSQ